jgi:hypothetical protein
VGVYYILHDEFIIFVQPAIVPLWLDYGYVVFELLILCNCMFLMLFANFRLHGTGMVKIFFTFNLCLAGIFMAVFVGNSIIVVFVCPIVIVSRQEKKFIEIFPACLKRNTRRKRLYYFCRLQWLDLSYYNQGDLWYR